MNDTISIDDFQRAKEALEKANIPGPYWAVIPPDDLAPTKCPCDGYLSGCQRCKEIKQEKGNNPMYFDEVSYNTKATRATACVQSPPMTINVQTNSDVKSDGVADQRKYLLGRVFNLRYVKKDELAKQFHRDEPDSPRTIKDLQERLKKGLYTITKPKGYDLDDEDEDDCIYWRDYFSWRTEDTQFDEAGYNAAYAELEEFVKSLEDQIQILDPKDTLSLLEDLKKWKPSKAKK